MAALSSWEEVRDLAGVQARFERGIQLLGTADGSNKTFFVPHNYIVDDDADEAVAKTGDIVVYDDGVSVSIVSVNELTGKIILTDTPLADSVMKADYAWSSVRDSRIAAVITRADGQVEKYSNTKGTATEYIQYWDGDGSKKKFLFKYRPVVSITEISVDGSTSGFTVNSTYWLYPTPTRALWIIFTSAPSRARQNVKITYNYGEANVLLSKLALYVAAREIVMEDVAKSAQGQGVYTGEEMDPIFMAEQKHLTLVRKLDEEIKRLKSELGGHMRIGVV